MKKSRLMFYDHRNKQTIIIKTMILVLEYFEKSLNSFLHNQDNSTKTLLSICKGIGKGLIFLYNQKVVHRDLKLDNILMDENDNPIICDFGLAMDVDENGIAEVNELGGNLFHLSPEVHNSFREQKKIRGFKIINYSKQPPFEFGLLCYIILLGTYPMNDVDYPGFGETIQIPQIGPERFVNQKDIPSKVVESICRLLSNDPEERPFIEEVIEYF